MGHALRNHIVPNKQIIQLVNASFDWEWEVRMEVVVKRIVHLYSLE